LWESVPPEKLLRLPEELARVDALLDDPAFFAPFVPFFATGKRSRAAGGAVRSRLRDRSCAAGRRAHEIATKLRTRSAAGREEGRPPCGGSVGSWPS
jgi:hypothetical protein